ncbi:hypothetical protein T06_16120 [Trichinella sp. T6]|nr:hypothetical protein T06_16120 [Trichinella sp. T6]
MFVSFVPGGAVCSEFNWLFVSKNESFSNGEKRKAPNYDCSETSNHSNG